MNELDVQHYLRIYQTRLKMSEEGIIKPNAAAKEIIRTIIDKLSKMSLCEKIVLVDYIMSDSKGNVIFEFPHMDSITLDEYFFKIDETDHLILGGCWESMFLIDKKTKNEIHLGDLDGVVDIGIIGKDNSWAITGREVIFLWRNEQVHMIEKKELACVEGIKLIDDNLVELNVDTLNLNGNKSKWTLNVVTKELVKIN